MHRVLLLVLLLFTAGLSACTKSDDVKAQVKAQAETDAKIISKYLKDNGLPEQHVDTTGVCYIVDSAGTGNNLYSNSTQVTVGYTGWLLTTNSTLGGVFSQTDNFHPSFTLGQVIRGWQVGIPKIKQGGAVTLYLPSRYAYGPYAQPGIGLPANACTVFHIILYNVTN